MPFIPGLPPVSVAPTRSPVAGAAGGGLRRDGRGTVAVAFALAAPALIGAAALAVDVGSWQAQRLAMQQSADQATLAAGVAAQVGANVTTEARALAAANGFVHGSNGVSVSVSHPPLAGASAGNVRAVEVAISKAGQSFFSTAFRAAPVLTTRAVAVPKGQYSGGTCVMALATTGVGIDLGGTAGVDAANCNIYSNSTAAGSISTSGSAVLRGYVVRVVGGIAKGGSSSVTGVNAVLTGVAATPDPYAARTIPSYSGCDATRASLGSGATVTAGAAPYVFCNGLSIGGSGTVTFNPGIYVIDRGTFNIGSSGTINATGGVTFILTSSTGAGHATMSMTGSQTFNIRAPSTGPTAGLAVWIDRAATGSAVSIGGSTVWNITGAFYAPATTLTWNGGGSSSCTQLIALRVTMTGSSGLNNVCAGTGVQHPPGSVVASAMALTE